jgi:hypothetical protein
MRDRFFDVEFDAAGTTFDIEVTPLASPAANAVLDFTLRYEDQSRASSCGCNKNN